MTHTHPSASLAISRGRFPRRRGTVLIYSISLMLVSTAFISLAVDYGRMQWVKTQEQRCADSLARGVLATCQARATSQGLTPTAAANLYSSYVVSELYPANPIAFSGGYSAPVPTVGSYYNGTFYADAGAHGPLALQVVISRTVNLAFPLPNGKSLIGKSCVVWAKAIAMLPNAVPLNETVQSTQDPWLAGMPSGSTASYNDQAPANSPTAMTVIPGSTITWNTVNGVTSHQGGNGVDGPDGETSNMYWHMKDPPSGAQALGNGGQNNIGDVYAPIDSLIGVFLNNNAPTSNTMPTGYRTSTTDMSVSNGVNNLLLQQPFYIGDGTTSSSTKQSFTVPNTATRLYLGIMDGFQWANNAGSLFVSGTEQPPIQMVQ